ncbi:MAG TPA: hypothetical protein VEH31_41660, partial [Streptosporangiaceae bacterium]|nr:hypothetical protein [Streptosporangiaceae bacterium]
MTATASQANPPRSSEGNGHSPEPSRRSSSRAPEPTGRRSGKTISFPAVIADYDNGRYLVSMLGEDTNWVRNVRASGGHAVLRHGDREPV